MGKSCAVIIGENSPYNTYIIKGLPPGPIANPGLDSFQAVLYPAAVNYLFFVSKKDGTHFFSSSLDAHNEAVLYFRTSPILTKMKMKLHSSDDFSIYLINLIAL